MLIKNAKIRNKSPGPERKKEIMKSSGEIPFWCVRSGLERWGKTMVIIPVLVKLIHYLAIIQKRNIQ